MLKLWRQTGIVDDMSGFGHLGRHIKGVPFYADRALLLPADFAVIMRDGEDVQAHLDYLRQVRIGPQRVLMVDNPNLLDGLDEDPRVMGEIEDYLRKSPERALQFFCMTERTEAFIDRHMIDPRRVDSPPRVISDRLNDKVQLRQIAKDCGLEHMLAPYVASSEPRAVMSAVKAFLAKPAQEIEYVVLKRTNLAGGDGFLKIVRDLTEPEVEAAVVEYLRAQSWNELLLTAHTDIGRPGGAPETLEIVTETLYTRDVRDISRDLETGLERLRALAEGMFAKAPEAAYLRLSRRNIFGGASIKIWRDRINGDALRRYLLDHCRNEILIEEGYDGDDFSTQVVVRDGEFRTFGPTKQIVDGQGRHLGNVMTRFYDRSLAERGMDGSDKDTMRSVSRDIAEHAHTRIEGYRGILGADFRKRRRDARMFLGEINARKTALSYPLGVLAQVEGRLREPLNAAKDERVNCGLVMYNAVPTSARSWGALAEKLGATLFNGVYGALPFNVRLMRLDQPAIGIVAVGKTLDEALATMESARAKLE